MINILHSIDTAGSGGAETVFYDIVTGIDINIFKSYVVIPDEGWLYNKLLKAGHKPIIIAARGSFNFNYLLQLMTIVRRFKINLIHSHLFGSNVYCSLVGLLTQTPVIATFHGFVDSDTNDKLLSLKFFILNKMAKKIIFVSRQLQENFIQHRGVEATLSEVVYNGVDTLRFKPGKSNKLKQEYQFQDKDIIIGSIGNIRPAKGYDILLRTAALVKEERRGIKFVVAGEGGGKLFEDLLNLRSSLGVEDTVFFLGFREDTVELLHNFDIFLLPSTSEGFSIATIEAMSCGVPVIATMSGGPEEIITSPHYGLLTAIDAASLKNAIIEMLANDSQRRNLAMQARMVVEERFSAQSMIINYSKIYDSVKLNVA